MTFTGETRAQAMTDGATVEAIDAAIRRGEVIESPAGCLFDVPPIATKLERDAYKVDPSRVRGLSPRGARDLKAWQARVAASCKRALGKHEPAPTPQEKARKRRNAGVMRYLTGAAPKRPTLPALPVVPVTHSGESETCEVIWQDLDISGDKPRIVERKANYGPCDVYRFGETGQIRIRVNADRGILGLISGKVKRAPVREADDDDAPLAPVDATPTPAEIEASMPLAWEAADLASAPDATPVEAGDAWEPPPVAAESNVCETDGNDVSRAMAARWTEEMEQESTTAATALADSLAALGIDARAWNAASAAEGGA